MATGPINNTTGTPLTRGTRPLDPQALASLPGAQPAAAPTAAPARDQAHTGPLDPTALTPAVDLDDIQIPTPPKPEEKKSWLGSVWGELKSVAGAVEHGVEKAVKVTEDVVGAGVKGVSDGLSKGDGLLDSLGEGASAAGGAAVRDIVDPVLDQTLGKADKAHDLAAGSMADLTDRIGVGQSVDIKIEAGVTLPTELVGAPNVKLDGGGKLTLKRVLAVDANNKPIMGADGKQETRLEVDLQAFGRAGAAYSAKVGFNATAKAGNYEVGASASARAEAEAGLTGSFDVKFRFNPNDAKDMGDLGAMTRSVATTGAAASVPGLGTLLAGVSMQQSQQVMANFGSHMESMGGEGGLYAQASASAKLNAGVFKASDAPDAASLLQGKGGTVAAKAANNAESSVMGKLNINVATVAASLGLQGTIGENHNYRTGETTYTFSTQGSAKASLSSLVGGVAAGGDGNRKINLVFGKDGKLKDVTVSQSMSRDQFKGAMTTVSDVYGRPLGPGVIAGMDKSDTVTVNYKLKPELLAQVSEAHDPQAIFQAAVAVTSAAITKDRFKLDQGDIVATHRDEVTYKFDAGIALFAEADIRAGITLGKSQETTLN